MQNHARKATLHVFSLVALFLASTAAFAGDTAAENTFFHDVAGQWVGPGKIVEGKLKGTRFKCNLSGAALEGKTTGFTLEGSCRAGLFSHPVTAEFIQDGASYRGHFLDGSDGDGLDVTGGTVEGRIAYIEVEREKVTGAIVTNLKSDDDLNITVLIKGGTTYVPVIGLSLKRKTDPMAVGAIK